ncbi:MAG TPA: hypothetical protein VFD39_04170, partial [Trueperaceae bacterium]|nr:hypothetical protein [Trueperaceae bacterium]
AADVSVTGRVSIGDLDSQLPQLEQRGVGLGSEVAGTLGQGTAKLQLRVTTGDLTIRAARSSRASGSDRG